MGKEDEQRIPARGTWAAAEGCSGAVEKRAGVSSLSRHGQVGGRAPDGGHSTWCDRGVEAGQGLPWPGNHESFGLVGEVGVDWGEGSFRTCNGG